MTSQYSPLSGRFIKAKISSTSGSWAKEPEMELATWPPPTPLTARHPFNNHENCSTFSTEKQRTHPWPLSQLLSSFVILDSLSTHSPRTHPYFQNDNASILPIGHKREWNYEKEKRKFWKENKTPFEDILSALWYLNFALFPLAKLIHMRVYLQTNMETAKNHNWIFYIKFCPRSTDSGRGKLQRQMNLMDIELEHRNSGKSTEPVAGKFASSAGLMRSSMLSSSRFCRSSPGLWISSPFHSL